MGLYEKLQTSVELETQGVLMVYKDLGLRMCVRRAGGKNSAYTRAIARQTRDFQRALDLDQVSEETMTAILLPVFADHVVACDTVETEVNDEGTPTVGTDKWAKGIENENGEVVPATKEQIIETFKALPLLFQRVREDSSRESLYLASAREAAAKNS
jgi:hypothetical protein